MSSSNNNITFSVVIPVYNGAATILRALASVVNQRYNPHQIIVVDDASTDNTCQLIKDKYGDTIILICKSKNEGSGAARNDGMNIATGSHIAFLDADDMWHKYKLQVIADVLTSKQDIVLLYHDYTLNDVSKSLVPHELLVDKVSFGRLLVGNLIATPCMVIRNDKKWRYEPTMRYTEDYDLCLRITYYHSAYYLPVQLTGLSRAITTPGGISANKWAMRKGELRSYSRLALLNKAFILLIPILWAWSVTKHIIKLANDASSPTNDPK